MAPFRDVSKNAASESTCFNSSADRLAGTSLVGCGGWPSRLPQTNIQLAFGLRNIIPRHELMRWKRPIDPGSPFASAEDASQVSPDRAGSAGVTRPRLLGQAAIGNQDNFVGRRYSESVRAPASKVGALGGGAGDGRASNQLIRGLVECEDTHRLRG